MKILTLLVFTLTLCLSLEARSRALDLKKRSSLNTQEPVAMSEADILKTSGFQGKRFEITQWHKKYSSIGRKRAGFSTDDNAYADAVVEMQRKELEKSSFKMTVSKSKSARIRNWNQMREAVMASNYQNIETQILDGAHIQEIIDQVSLAQINRFQTVRNQPGDEDGIPVQAAAENEAADD